MTELLGSKSTSIICSNYDCINACFSSIKSFARRSVDDLTITSVSSDEPEEEQLQDGRWIYIRQRSVEDGGMVGVWTDVTPINWAKLLIMRRIVLFFVNYNKNKKNDA